MIVRAYLNTLSEICIYLSAKVGQCVNTYKALATIYEPPLCIYDSFVTARRSASVVAFCIADEI
jgi:hypothetical protein